MKQEELEELLRQIAPNNDPGRLVFSEATETVEQDVPGPTTYEPPTKQKRPVRVLQWTDPGTGQTLRVQMNPSDGTYTKTFQGIDPKQQGQPATTATSQQGTPTGSRQSTDAAGNVTKVTTYERPDGTTYEREDTVTQAPKPATRNETPVTVNGKNLIKVETVDPATGQSKTVLLDPVTRAEVQAPEPPKPAAQVVSAPSNQKWIARQNPATNEVEFVRNQNYVPDSKLVTDPTTGRMRVLTEDENGNPVLKDLNDQTTIKPNDIPVLQAKYGQIGQSLGAYLTDLNGRVSRGEMTPQERDAAFKAAHQQAEVQVSEINSILENSKAVWSRQVEERGQTFTEAANRRSFAGSVMGNALTTGREMAQGALPGSGRAIAEGVMTLMDMGQRYAGGMGGFPSMAPTPLPPALQQAASMNLPGFGPELAGGPPAPSMTSDAGGSPSPGPSTQSMVGVPAAAPPSGGAPPGRPAPLLPPPPPVPGQSPLPPGGPRVAPPSAIEPIPNAVPGQGVVQPIPNAVPGQGPIEPIPLAPPGPLGGLGSMFGAGIAGSPMGVPASAGGGGLFDPALEGQSMLSASMTGGYGGAGVADPDWERAVQAAMGLFG